jgi:lambda family phage tail tape measure protein
MADEIINLILKATDQGAGSELASTLESFENIYAAAAKIVETVLQIVEKIKKTQEEVRNMRLEFDAAALSVAKHASAVELSNQQMEDQIAKLEGRPAQNRLSISLLEAANSAIDLANSLEQALQKEEQLLRDKSIGIWESLVTGQTQTNDLYEKLKPGQQKLDELLLQAGIAEAQFTATHNDLQKQRTLAQQNADAVQLASIRKSYADQIAAASAGVEGILNAEQKKLNDAPLDRLLTHMHEQVAEMQKQGRTPDDINAAVETLLPKWIDLAMKSTEADTSRQQAIDRVRLSILSMNNAEVASQINLRDHIRLAKGENKKEAEDRANATETQVKQLEVQAAAMGTVAGAQRQNTAATLADVAAAEAQKTITEINNEATLKKVPLLSEEQKKRIEVATALKTYSSAVQQASTEAARAATQSREQTESVNELASAYAKGGDAIQQAQEHAQLRPYQEKVRQLTEALEQFKSAHPEATAQIEIMARALAEAGKELNSLIAAFHEYDAARQSEKTKEMVVDLQRQATNTQGYVTAILRGTEALRQYNIQQQISAYLLNPATDHRVEAVNQYRQALEGLSQAEQLRAAAEKVHSVDRRGDLEQEIASLKKLQAAALQSGQSTLAIDGLIHQDRLQQERDLSNLLLQTGKIKDGLHAFLLDYKQQAEINGKKIHDALMNTLNGMTSTMSKFIVEGKADWKQFAASAIEQFVEMGLQWAIQQTVMAAINKLTSKQSQDDDEEAMAVKSASNVAEAISDAAVAAAGAFAYYSAFAPEIAGELAAAQFEEGMLWAGVAAFEQGGIVPATGLALVHQGERILPASMSGRGDFGPGGGGVTVVVNHSVNAVDADSFQKVIRRHGNLIGNEVARVLKKKGIASR